MFELFVVGTFWFWALVVAEIFLLFLFIENENGVAATISLFCSALLLQWFGDVDIIGFITTNPIKMALLIAVYFAFGGIWGVCKWWLLCRDRLEEYEELKASFFRDVGVPSNTKVVPVEHRVEWKVRIDKYKYRYDVSKPPLVRENKGKILRWMTFWWVSLVWTFINDFVKRTFKAIYNRIATFMQRMADGIFAKANVSQDLTLPEEAEET